jgi:hypothetical protein
VFEDGVPQRIISVDARSRPVPRQGDNESTAAEPLVPRADPAQAIVALVFHQLSHESRAAAIAAARSVVESTALNRDCRRVQVERQSRDTLRRLCTLKARRLKGVFRYAAFEYEQGERFVTQPVVDWVGEVPLIPGTYTYHVNVEQSAGIALMIRLTDVVRDR